MPITPERIREIIKEYDERYVETPEELARGVFTCRGCWNEFPRSGELPVYLGVQYPVPLPVSFATPLCLSCHAKVLTPLMEEDA